jgi:hypothetical protein
MLMGGFTEVARMLSSGNRDPSRFWVRSKKETEYRPIIEAIKSTSNTASSIVKRLGLADKPQMRKNSARNSLARLELDSPESKRFFRRIFDLQIGTRTAQSGFGFERVAQSSTRRNS